MVASALLLALLTADAFDGLSFLLRSVAAHAGPVWSSLLRETAASEDRSVLLRSDVTYSGTDRSLAALDEARPVRSCTALGDGDNDSLLFLRAKTRDA